MTTLQQSYTICRRNLELKEYLPDIVVSSILMSLCLFMGTLLLTVEDL